MSTSFRVLIVAAVFVPSCFSAKLAISTYFKDGFAPTAIAADGQDNVFVAGSAVIDAASQTTGVAVAKLTPTASRYVYLTYLDSAASDQVSAIAVDGAGNAYIAGWTTNSNFAVVGAGSLGTSPKDSLDKRTFLTKLDPDGGVIFSILVGGSVSSRALGVALTPEGQVVVSGIAEGSGFASTPGAYKIAETKGHWFLMELDAAGSKVVFSATGIGGSAIAFDTVGNIYLAGSSVGTDYPATPGAYQTAFVQGHYCFNLCQIGFDGVLQHVTKVDPAGSKLIYSTGLNDPAGGAGNTTNTGLAVDAAGNAFVTGTLSQAQYPFTGPVPENYSGYLTKLDSTGSSVMFSIPVGGGGVKLDSSGAVYIGGIVASSAHFIGLPSVVPIAPPMSLSGVPQACWPNNAVANNGAYLMKVDAATGSVQDAQWIGGSGPGATGIALAGGKVWITGATPAADVPMTPGALSPQRLGAGFRPGAFLAAADFTASANRAPQIACVLDTANLSHLRAAAAFQVISLFGENLGPATGVAAQDPTETSLADVTVTFDGNPAQLIYVSSTQINVAVPAPPPSRESTPPITSTVMEVTVNGVSTQRRLPFTTSNLSLFADLSAWAPACAHGALLINEFQPLAGNADGTHNSCGNPAKYGSTISLYAHGVGAIQYGFPPAAQIFGLQALADRCSAAVESATLVNGLVYKVDVRLPDALSPCALSLGPPGSVNSFGVTLSYNGAPLGPLSLAGEPMRMVVWVTQ